MTLAIDLSMPPVSGRRLLQAMITYWGGNTPCRGTWILRLSGVLQHPSIPIHTAPALDPSPQIHHPHNLSPTTQLKMNPDLDFTYSENTYYCKLCPLARGTTHWSRHVRSAAHQRNVERLETASRPISPPRPISPDPIAAARAPPAQAEDAVFHVGGPGLFELNKDPPISAPYVQGFIAALAADHVHTRAIKAATAHPLQG
ncbi:hypothetical protein PTTG_30989 [Puccinia triticina 1-1 BBBD Race 1]|uniref:U1-type domain-containing protein n=1 Tax=Puccinia triticina (isolate 1-1 / race 1 (BBBD)) TaxID=630390 RepID=A0A180FX43_PUCT1|nr:hypothetical protein PTTG_30989 [Puccinia triticina 1-1 BBBD Race 1]